MDAVQEVFCRTPELEPGNKLLIVINRLDRGGHESRQRCRQLSPCHLGDSQRTRVTAQSGCSFSKIKYLKKEGDYQQFRGAEGDIEAGFKEIVKLRMHDDRASPTPKRNMIPIPSNYEISDQASGVITAHHTR